MMMDSTSEYFALFAFHSHEFFYNKDSMQGEDRNGKI